MDRFTDKELQDLTLFCRKKIYREYARLCNNININEWTIYKIENLNKITYTDLKYIYSFIIIYDNLEYLFDTVEEVSIWFRRVKERFPFNGRSPLEFMQNSKSGILRVKLYTNAGRVEFGNAKNK